MSNIKMQKIKITEYKELDPSYRFVADPIDQPGSPRIGTGKSPLLSLIDLLKYNEKFNIDVIVGE